MIPEGCVMQFWPPDDEHMCSKHVEAWNKLILKQKFCASSWLITEINVEFYSKNKFEKLVHLFGFIIRIYDKGYWILLYSRYEDDNNNNNNKLQLGCHPVAVVILHVYKIWNWLLINLSLESYMRSM